MNALSDADGKKCGSEIIPPCVAKVNQSNGFCAVIVMFVRIISEDMIGGRL
jgi:hypothetical protein